MLDQVSRGTLNALAAEAGNNACIGGALIPMLTLAIPGDAVTSVILAAFYVHGLQPGPLLFVRTPELFSVVISGGFLACLAMLVLGMTVVPRLSKIVLVSKRLLSSLSLPCSAWWAPTG